MPIQKHLHQHPTQRPSFPRPRDQPSDLEELGLEAGESAADPQVELLAGVHAARLVLVGLHQAVHGGTNVAVGDGREAGPENGLWKGGGAALVQTGSIGGLLKKKTNKK